MAASPRSLPAVVTRGKRDCAKFDYAGLRCRKADGRGLVLTIEDLDAARPEYLADLLASRPGIRVQYASSHFGPAQVPSTPGRCLVTLIAGMTSYRTWSPWDSASVKDVVGLEVYAPHEIPPEFRYEARRGGESCWLINVWDWGTLK
jgi:hypothetical protein